MLVACAWGVLALRYWDHASPSLRVGLALAYGIISVSLCILFALRVRRWTVFGAFAALFALLLTCWLALEPSNDRDWQQETAVLASASITGDRVVLHNIRDFVYRTETDFTPRYYDREFALSQLESVDMFAAYWMGPAIAHIFLSFGFAGGSHVAISIEARKERDESYSSLQGFFRQYELYYVVGDERDIVRLRTNVRQDPPEHVYLYRLRGSRVSGQRLFLEYVRRINQLHQRAEWYNTLTTNCTNNIWLHSRINPGHVPYSWQVLLSGYLPEYLYARGKLDTDMTFAELQRHAQINALAQLADGAEDFSRRIRAGQTRSE
jgi:Domain of unknown function (DUF4105)